MTWRRGLVCLGIICALQIQPLTVLADGSFPQADLTDSALQADPEGPIVQVNPAENLIGEGDDSTPAYNAASLEVATGAMWPAVPLTERTTMTGADFWEDQYVNIGCLMNR